MPNNEQPGFVLYNSYAEHFALLSMEDRGALITALFEYQTDGTTPDCLSPAANMAFSFIKLDLDANAQKYREKCDKNRENGTKGGRPKKQTDNSETERFSEKPKKPNINKNKNTNLNQNLDNTPPTPSKGGEVCAKRFAEFWDAYPRKEGKERARQAFKKLRPDEDLLRRMLDAVELQKSSDQWTREDGKYIPHPATWLNGRRWEDEVKPASSGNMFADYLAEMRGGGGTMFV